MVLFYTQDIDKNRAVLHEDEARHCSRVLRKNIGDKITITNGVGDAFHGIITSISKKNVMVEKLSPVTLDYKSDFHIHIAIAPTKNISRFEWFLEKATELGIHTITPLLCANSERKIIKHERSRKILLTAMKQSLRTYLPLLEPIVSFASFLSKIETKNKYIAHFNSENLHLMDEINKAEDILVMIGPEGDFSKQELELAKSRGFKLVNLGTSRLRTETAAIVACHCVNLKNEAKFST